MDDVTQIPQDIVAEGAKISKGVAKSAAETIGAASSQLTGQKPKDPAKVVEGLTKRDKELKKQAISEILARLQRMKEEEAKLAQKREEGKRDWVVSQSEKMKPPQIERAEKPKVLPQVAKQRAETKVGWGAG